MSITIIGDNYDDDDDDDDTSKKHFLSLYGPSIKWINKYKDVILFAFFHILYLFIPIHAFRYKE